MGAEWDCLRGRKVLFAQRPWRLCDGRGSAGGRVLHSQAGAHGPRYPKTVLGLPVSFSLPLHPAPSWAAQPVPPLLGHPLPEPFSGPMCGCPCLRGHTCPDLLVPRPDLDPPRPLPSLPRGRWPRFSSVSGIFLCLVLTCVSLVWGQG